MNAWGMILFAILGLQAGHAEIATTPLPTPPHQGGEWTPPPSKRIPKSWIAAAKTLVAAGVADPRGCEYREVVIPFPAMDLPTHAWVIPSETGPTHAICWNGWVYPVSEVGEKVPLAPDVWEMMANAPKSWHFNSHHHHSETWYVVETRFQPVPIVLLLLLGEEKLANNLWSIWSSLLDHRFKEERRDPLWLFANAWINEGTIATLNAFCESKDALARHRCTVLAKAEPILRQALQTGDFHGLSILSLTKQIAADLQRRAKLANNHTLKDWQTLTPDSFVAQLEHATGVWDSFSNRTEMNEAALVIGQDLVPPLIKCLESDTRLSRMELGHGAFRPRLGVVPVSALAYQLLTELLHTRQFGTDNDYYFDPLSLDGEKRREAAARIREYAIKHTGEDPPSRWYAILQDDDAGAIQWLTAAEAIIAPSNTFRTYRRENGDTIVVEERTIEGNSLRAKTSPSISELFATRAEQMVPSGDVNEETLKALARSCEVAFALHEWDPAAALPVFEKQIARCYRVWEGSERGLRRSRGQILTQLPEMVLTLGQSGNTAVIDGYAEWFRNQPWLDLKDSVSAVFAPIAAFPDHAGMRKAAEWAFLAPHSPWTPFIGKHSEYSTRGMMKLLEDEKLLNVPAYCDYLSRELEKDKRGGSLIVGDNGHLYAKIDRLGTVNAQPDPKSPPKPGTAHLLSTADLLAYHLSQHHGMPTFHLDWPKVRRKAGLMRMQAALQARHKQ